MRSHGGILFLLCILVGLAGVGLAVFALSTESEAAAAVVPAPGPATAVEAPVAPAEPIAVDGVFQPSDRAAVIEADAPAKRTFGLIRGDVTLEARSVERIQGVTIRIFEAVRDDSRKPFTYQYTIPFDPRDGTPRFCVDEIPFSDVGYLVQALVPGLNGTEQMVQLDEAHPVADVVLGVHGGTPFSVLLRDQDLAPLVAVEVTLVPEGSPQGRPTYYEKSDTFGAAVFHDVLRGAYQAHIGPQAQPLLPPQPIEVLASSGLQAQSKTLVVPKGESLTVNLFDASGHGAVDVEIKLSSGSDVRYREIKQKSDWSGRTTFTHLTPGSYWINVLDPRYHPRTVPTSVRTGEKPKDIDIRLLMR